MQSPLQQPLQPMQSPFQQPLQSPLQQPIQPIQSPPQQPQQTPQQPQQTPLQQPPQQTPPQQTPTIQDCATHSPPSRLGLKKITLLWTRVATHTLAFVHEGATTVPLKALITQLRQRDVDLDALKAAARALLDENPNLESVGVPHTIRLLVLLNDPNTPTQAPRTPVMHPSLLVAASDLPTVPGDAEFFTQAQQALKRIREEVDALRKAGQGAPQLFGSTEDPRKERGFFENIKELFEAQLRKGDLRDIEQLAGFLDVFAEIKRKMQARAPVEEVRALQVGASRGAEA